MFIESLVVGAFGANCYLLKCECSGKGIVIDPGDEVQRIIKKTRQMNMQVEKIVLTHGHPDHCAGVKELKENTKALIAMHAGDLEIVNSRLLRMMLGIKDNTKIEPDELLVDGNVIKVGSIEFVVIHTPGHSQGSICLKSEGILFTGDLLFSGGIGRCDLPGGDQNQITESLHKVMKMDPSIKVYPGHGPSTTIEAESRGNIYLDGWV